MFSSSMVCIHSQHMPWTRKMVISSMTSPPLRPVGCCSAVDAGTRSTTRGCQHAPF